MKTRLACILLAYALTGGLFAADPGGAVAALQAVPVRYNNGILELKGRGGNPDPAEWVIVARDLDNEGDITSLTFAGGQLLREAPSLNLGQMFRQHGYIYPPAIKVDSSQAWSIAASYAQANGAELASADYLLVQKGEDVPPIWTLTCHNADGRFIGELQILATNGEVIAHKGFAKTP